MFRRLSGGGVISPESNAGVTIRRSGAIGDALCATVVADRLIDLGLEVNFQAHSHCHCVLRLHNRLSAITAPSGAVTINLDNSYEADPNRRGKHFHQMFFESANRQLQRLGINLGKPTNCRPKLRRASPLNFPHPKPWVMICPRSNSYNVRQVPDGIWQEAAKKIPGTCFWIGTHPAPAGIVDLQCRHFDTVLSALSAADLLITVDTGPLHVAAALGVPIVAINQSSSPDLHLNDQNDFVSVSPNLDCLNCQLNICPKSQHIPPCQNVSPDLIAEAATKRLSARSDKKVSAIVTIYRPQSKVLNKCLECVIPQVDEVIVTGGGESICPADALKHQKVKYVRKNVPGMGYGQNANHGARHSNGHFLLLLNDDVFLDPGAVDRMVAEMRPDVGAVSHLLRYPTGQIYHAGKVRSPGVRGWGHIDHLKYHPTFTEPMDLENLCGASVLVRREAFYRIGGFDEDYYLYAEDDDMMLRLRKDGWALRYTPHATGIHMEGQTTRILGRPGELVGNANVIFHQKWGAYLDWNLNRVPGNFDYLRA